MPGKQWEREHWTDYARLYYERTTHHRRYVAYVEAHGLWCQECGGMGHGPDSSYYGPGEPCGFCETTGKVTRHMRGLWLRWKREEARERRKKRAA